MSWHEKRFIYSAAKVEVECCVCSKKMWLPSSKADKYKTCGDVCSKKNRDKSRETRTRKCQTCGNTFTPRWSQIKAGKGIFCSQKCNVSAREAVNSKEAQIKARENWKKRHAISPIVKSGELNNRWSGGPAAKKLRDKENGWPSQAARRAKTDKPLPNGTINKIGELQSWRCACCGVSIKKNRHVDHIVPLKRGGSHSASNIQLLCPQCNLSKAAKDPIEFMQQRGFLI